MSLLDFGNQILSKHKPELFLLTGALARLLLLEIAFFFFIFLFGLQTFMNHGVAG